MSFADFHGNLETLLEDNDLDDDETQHIYQVMKRHSDRLNLLANDLLSLAQLESKEATLHLVEINLGDFLEDATRDWTKRFAKKNLRLELQVPTASLIIRADEMLTAFVELQQAIHEFAVSLIS